MTLFILYALTKLVNVVTVFLTAKAAKTESVLDDQLVPLLGKTIKWFIWIIGGLLFLQNVLNYNISSLLAGLGIGGLAVAFAAQDTVANIFGAIMIFVDRPFKVGDAVSMEGFEGAVESIGLRSTRIRTWDGTLVTIPNRTVASANINNLAARPMRRTNLPSGSCTTPRPKSLRRPSRSCARSWEATQRPASTAPTSTGSATSPSTFWCSTGAR